MSIKDLYKEMESDKKNEVKGAPKVSLPRDIFISEHKQLIKILRSGDKKAQEAEAAKQEAELAEELGESESDDEDAEEDMCEEEDKD